jgi:hypothetical protein
VPLEEVARPAFPCGVLPPWLEDYVGELATELQVPVDLVALLALAVCAAACSQRARIRVRARFEEPLNIWVLVPLPSGHRKSAAVAEVTAPVRRWQQEQAEALRESVAEGASRLRMAQLALGRAEAAAAKAVDHTERLRAEADALELARHMSGLRVPQAPRLLAHDITAERLASLMAEHDERMAIIAPEGTIFELMSGRYSAGIPNIDIYKAAHAGDMFAVDREADRAGRPPIILERPALTLAIAPQPDVVRKLTDKEQFRGEGLLARFLYSLPTSMLGRRDMEPEPARPATLAAYEQGVRSLLDLPAVPDAQGKPVPAVLTCAPRARASLLALARDLEQRMGDAGDLEPIADWASKLAGQTARLAGVLHLATWAGDPSALGRPVEETTMDAAVQLACYFMPHARMAFALMGTDSVRDAAAHLLHWIERWMQRPPEVDEEGKPRDHRAEHAFSRHECWHNNRSSRFKRAEDVEGPLALLCEHGYIRARGPSAGKKGGRPASQIYDVHPDVGSQNPQNSQNEAKDGGFGGFGGFGGHHANGRNGHDAAAGASAQPQDQEIDDDSVEV